MGTRDGRDPARALRFGAVWHRIRALVSPMINDTRRRLKEWGQWASGGEPSLGSMFRALFGSNSSNGGEMPPHVHEVDAIVCRLEPILRGALIQVYTRGGSFSSKALILGIARQTLKDRVDRAEWEVNEVLDGYVESVQPVKNVPYIGENAVFHRKGV